MNNQAAQTMPELPEPWQCETAMCPDLYTADQMRAYARAALAAPRQEEGDESDEDAHVIMMLGRLLAEIAIILKGPEPAGTAWSYHDLPEMVRAVTQESKDVADEMQAWANVKMTERGSSRRDKLMVAEWSKRLSGAATVTFPVKDFDVSGTTLTKQEMRAAVRRVMQSRVFAGQDFGRGDSINVLYVYPAEQREPHPDALPDGTLSKSTAKRVGVLAAASVSERARALLAAEFARAGMPFNAADCARGEVSPTYEPALRAIEQALTQQRGEASYDAGIAMHWIERYAAGIDEECQLDRIAEAFTTPPAQRRRGAGVGEAVA